MTVLSRAEKHQRFSVVMTKVDTPGIKFKGNVSDRFYAPISAVGKLIPF